ncbi:MAG: XdhC family protein, partial [Dactylosporangium sp.]|nr:XdhC family protein [Dactylosporangium sp.]
MHDPMVGSPASPVDPSADGWEVLDQARELRQRGEEFVLATVVWRAGPSSGHPGARAVITASGDIHGWIGGACAEPVVVREAQRVMAEGKPKLLALGPAETFAGLPEGTVAVPISCQSEGALQVYLEPVLPALHLVVVGRSPMAHTLVELARTLGWRADRYDWEQFTSADVTARSLVVVATQGHGDEEALQQVMAMARDGEGGALPAYVGLVASRKRGESVLGALADKGVPRQLLDRVRVPAGLDLGHTTHREIAVTILAELVKLRAAGELRLSAGADRTAVPPTAAGPTAATGPAMARDPVCGMTVPADASSRPYEYEGVTYYFCCPGCRRAFERDPSAYLSAVEVDQSSTPTQPPVEA